MAGEAPVVSVGRASPDEMPIVHHLFVAYFYDLSEFDDNLIVNDWGLPWWAPNGLPGPRTFEECWRGNWWIRDRCEPYVIRVNGRPAGFAIVCRDRVHLPPEIDNELLDFYIAPKYRRRGVGRLAARQLFDRYAGAWQLFELERNVAARAFWRTVIDEYTGGRFDDLDGGTQQRFTR